MPAGEKFSFLESIGREPSTPAKPAKAKVTPLPKVIKFDDAPPTATAPTATNDYTWLKEVIESGRPNAEQQKHRIFSVSGNSADVQAMVSSFRSSTNLEKSDANWKKRREEVEKLCRSARKGAIKEANAAKSTHLLLPSGPPSKKAKQAMPAPEIGGGERKPRVRKRGRKKPAQA